MRFYSDVYLDEIVENQGKLFDLVSWNYPDMDTIHFIKSYMKSNTRKHIDEGQAYLCTMAPEDLLSYFIRVDNYEFKAGESIQGFLPDWIGQFYAYYQWYYKKYSRDVVDKVTVEYLMKAYPGLHDLELELAVTKVGES